MVLSSEIIEIVKSPDIFVHYICILWTEGRSLVQGGNYWVWREGGEGGLMCPVFPTLDPPLIIIGILNKIASPIHIV